MTRFLNNVDVSTRAITEAQGVLVGTVSEMPAPSILNVGCTVFYTGTTGNYDSGCLYTCVQDGANYNWEKTAILAQGLDLGLSNADAAVITDASGRVIASDISTAELGFLSGVSSNIQNQLNGKVPVTRTINGQALSQDLTFTLSDFANNAGFIDKTVSDLENYYLKTETYSKSEVYSKGETYSRTEVNNLISSIPTMSISVVAQLPTQNISTTTIYLVPKSGSGNDTHDEYIYVDNKWELIGSTAVDLSDYYTKAEVDAKEVASASFTNNGLVIVKTNGTQITATPSGAISNIVTSNLTASRALVSDASGKIAVSTTTGIEIGYLHGVTSAIQTQLNSKAASSTVITGGTFSIIDESELSLTLNTQGGTDISIGPVELPDTGASKGSYTLTINNHSGSPVSGITVLATPVEGDTVSAVSNNSGQLILRLEGGVSYTLTYTVPDQYVTPSSNSVTVNAGAGQSATLTLTTKPYVTVYAIDRSSSGYQANRNISVSIGSRTVSTNSSGTVSFYADSDGSCTFTMLNVPEGGTCNPVTTQLSYNGTFSVDLIIVFSKIWGVRIDETNSDADAAVTYTDDAAGFTPMSMSNNVFSVGSWAGEALISGIEPGILHNGAFTPLDKRNPSQYASGGTAPTTAGYDYVVRVPCMGVKIERSGNYLDVKFTDDLDAESQGFTYWRHQYKGEVQANFHIGMHLMYTSGSNAYSIPGVSPTGSISWSTSATYCQNRGDGFDITRFQMYDFMSLLFLVLFKSRDGQSALGNGLVNTSKTNTANLTYTNDYGMYGTTANQTTRMSFFWINDYWGNMRQWIGCMRSGSSRQIYLTDGDSNTTFTDVEIASGVSSNSNGYVSRILGNNQCGIIPTGFSGSATTYYCDYGHLPASGFPYFGGSFSLTTFAGPFYVYVTYASSNTATGIGARLSYAKATA